MNLSRFYPTRFRRMFVIGALMAATLITIQAPTVAQASDCRWIFCGTVKNEALRSSPSWWDPTGATQRAALPESRPLCVPGRLHGTP